MKSAQSTQESEWYTQNNWHTQWYWTDCNIAIILHIRLEDRLYFKKIHASDSTTNRASFNFHTGSLNPSKVDQLLNDLVLMHVRHESTAEWVRTPTPTCWAATNLTQFFVSSSNLYTDTNRYRISRPIQLLRRSQYIFTYKKHHQQQHTENSQLSIVNITCNMWLATWRELQIVR